jgi:hypothetical protein
MFEFKKIIDFQLPPYILKFDAVLDWKFVILSSYLYYFSFGNNNQS